MSGRASGISRDSSSRIGANSVAPVSRPWLIDPSLAIPRAGLSWLAASLLLLSIGLVTVYSASFYRALVREVGEYHFLQQQLLGAGLGLAALFVASRIEPRRWIEFAPVAYLGTLLALVLVWSPIGLASGGAHRWIDLGVVGLQSSELSKVAIPLMIVWYLTRYGDLAGEQTRLKVHVNILLIGSLLLPVGLILLQPDLGTAAFILAVGFLVVLCSGVPIRYSAALGVLASPLLIWQVYERWPVIVKRFEGMTNPDRVDQVRHALTAIRAGGLEGAGVGRGTEKTLYLFAEFSDFIFAVYAEETGLIGIALLFVLYVALLLSGWRIIRACRDFHLRLLATAITCNLIIQALINLAVNTALAPTKGIALPFISHGSTGLSIALLQVGILLAIARVSRRDPEYTVTAKPADRIGPVRRSTTGCTPLPEEGS